MFMIESRRSPSRNIFTHAFHFTYHEISDNPAVIHSGKSGVARRKVGDTSFYNLQTCQERSGSCFTVSIVSLHVVANSPLSTSS